jgi:ATP-binding cassette subfamily F protein 3
MFTVAEAEAAIKAIQPPVAKQKRLFVRLGSGQASGERVLSLNQLAVGFPDRELFKVDDVHLYRGQIAALVGPNGAGKTTLLKTLLKQIKPLEGSFSLGHNVRVGYFAQAHEGLDLTRTVLDSDIAAGEEIGKAIGLREARTSLGAYLFRGDDAFKRTGDLSGGERGRLALAILAMQGANLLLLDEPTNHLDIQSQETLQDVLEAFEGTILMVSHDRYLVDKLATHLWEVDGGMLKISESTLVPQPA